MNGFSAAFRNASRWALKKLDTLLPPRQLRIIPGDSLPKSLPWRDLVLARDGDEEWCVGMRCPCRCGSVLEVMVLPAANPRWDVTVDAKGHPSLSPSVWLKKGCRSHFWVRQGRIHWC
ncbi:MAG: DUF6527 family protein [Polynucleobacter sp.]|nr:DUF6527 family protein [Polynucleobacter sp.]